MFIDQTLLILKTSLNM